MNTTARKSRTPYDQPGDPDEADHGGKLVRPLPGIVHLFDAGQRREALDQVPDAVLRAEVRAKLQFQGRGERVVGQPIQKAAWSPSRRFSQPGPGPWRRRPRR
jgi:hypothetical protein